MDKAIEAVFECLAIIAPGIKQNGRVHAAQFVRMLNKRGYVIAIEAAQALAQEREGYVWVPVEPTEEMHEAANREWDGRMSARSAGVWKAMIAAASPALAKEQEP